MRHAAVIALVLLAGCGRHGDSAPGVEANSHGLEAAAIQAGVISDPNDGDITGLYARESDRVCVVPSATAYRVGVSVDYGDQQSCSAAGTATRSGETLHVDLDGIGCSFDARFDGDRIVLPGRLPDSCQRACSRRASMAGLEVERLSESASEASTLRDAGGRLLCGAGG